MSPGCQDRAAPPGREGSGHRVSQRWKSLGTAQVGTGQCHRGTLRSLQFPHETHGQHHGQTATLGIVSVTLLSPACHLPRGTEQLSPGTPRNARLQIPQAPAQNLGDIQEEPTAGEDGEELRSQIPGSRPTARAQGNHSRHLPCGFPRADRGCQQHSGHPSTGWAPEPCQATLLIQHSILRCPRRVLCVPTRLRGASSAAPPCPRWCPPCPPVSPVSPVPGQVAVLLQVRVSRSSPLHSVPYGEETQERVRTWEPWPHVREHTLH